MPCAVPLQQSVTKLTDIIYNMSCIFKLQAILQQTYVACYPTAQKFAFMLNIFNFKVLQQPKKLQEFISLASLLDVVTQVVKLSNFLEFRPRVFFEVNMLGT